MPDLGVNATWGRDDFSAVLIEALSTQSALLQSGARRIPIAGKRAYVPRILLDPEADWVAEGAELPTDAGEGDSVELVPRKIGDVVTLSRESVEDAPVDELEAVGRSLMRGVARKADAKAFSSDAATAVAPAGLLSYTLPGAAGDVTIAGITTAVGVIDGEGGIADTVFLNSADKTAIRLAAVEGGYPISDPTAPGIERVAGARLITAPLPAGTAIVCVSDYLLVGVRRDIAVDVSSHAKFTSDSLAARVTARLDWDIADPAAFYVIT